MKMKIFQRKISDLKSSEYNPRKWSDKAIKDLTESIKEFGLVDPIIINRYEQFTGKKAQKA